ncbi:MAG: TolC family outer membrane protein [Sulfuricurvum sp.]|uniref:TolC family outer membrane protein n=1 Tax=Sulfuricurvum sp. TaxID=2025608 RepID=UPI002628ABA0|nr:TolC family outer membrane protein [Sulfuricurvum sp.]MDD2828992.1 TolC family outer membrane protein [Sulfuricurvum sp.]MDD4950091.1 TolC family outer membrane protein [Sulfuricurvum sp.]
MKNKWAIAATFSLCAISALHALSLQEGVDEILNTNPIVQERLHNYRGTLEDLRTTEAQYLPSLDYSGTIGREKTKSPSTGFNSVSLNGYEHSLQLTQNLFNGFGTMYESDYNKARLLAAAYNYVENANDASFNFVTAYINALKARDIVKIAESNVQYNKVISIKVDKLFKAGMTTRSEVEKAETSLSLAESNYVVSQNNLDDALFNLERIYGKSVKANELESLIFEGQIPDSLEEMREYAQLHNPSVMVTDYNIKAARAQKLSLQKNYYPKIDAFARQSWANNVGGLEGNDERTKLGINLSYNLYRGGADESQIQKSLSKMNQETEIKRDVLRKLDEQGSLSWSAKENLQRQITYLKRYETTSKKTLELYEKEYDLGRRTLLDLTTAQNDHVSSQTQIVRAEHDLLLAHYRILDAMGSMVSTILGTQSVTNFERVGLKSLDNRLDNDDRIENLIVADRKIEKYKKDKQQK